jgi:hypothetical protein
LEKCDAYRGTFSRDKDFGRECSRGFGKPGGEIKRKALQGLCENLPEMRIDNMSVSMFRQMP